MTKIPFYVHMDELYDRIFDEHKASGDSGRVRARKRTLM